LAHGPRPCNPCTPSVGSGKRRASAIWIAATGQFLTLLGFVIIMPLGPEIAADIGLSPSKIGYANSAYALAGALSGLYASNIVDRFGRRSAYALALCGLGLGTLLLCFAGSMETLLLGRMLAGACGGPATTLGLAIAADLTPAERRSSALSAIMGVSPLISIAGVPFALELSSLAGWRVPFAFTGAAALLTALTARLLLPPLRGHIRAGEMDGPPLLRHWRRPAMRAMALAVFLCAFSFNMLTASNPVILLLNLHFPRSSLGLFYLLAGLTSLSALRLAARAADRHGDRTPMLIGSALFVLGAFSFYVIEVPLPVGALSMPVMLTGVAVVNVAMWSSAMQLPDASDRAGYGAILGALQNLACAIGAGGASRILVDLPGPRLGNTSVIGVISICGLLLAVLVASRGLAGQNTTGHHQSGPLMGPREEELT